MTVPCFSDIDVALRGGRRVHIRTVRSSDEGELLQAFQRLDADARYMRFMRVVGEPNVAQLRKVLASFPESGIGLVATIPAVDGIDIVGSALAVVVGSDPASCEFSVTVARHYGGAGLGHALMSALIAAARARGLVEMEGFVLRVNGPMLGLASRLGFALSSDPDDPSVAICRLRLDTATTNRSVDQRSRVQGSVQTAS